MKNYTRIACAKEMVNFPGETRPKNTILLWWGDPGWMLGAHPASPSLPSSAGQGTEHNERFVGPGRGTERSLSTVMGKTGSMWGN